MMPHKSRESIDAQQKASYEEQQLKQMSNEELIEELLVNNTALTKRRDSTIKDTLFTNIKFIKAEFLSRLNRDPMSENCGNCRYAFGSLCINAEAWLNGVTVDCSIRCSFWKG